MLSKKDVVAINREFDTGVLVNESSLNYALETTRRSKNWLKSAALLVRAVLVDHVFQEGNKRTAAAIIMTYLEMGNFHFDPNRVNSIVLDILKKNITDVRKIERLIYRGTK